MASLAMALPGHPLTPILAGRYQRSQPCQDIQSRYDCELAAKEVNEVDGLSAVCIDGPKRSDSGEAQGGRQYPDPR